MNFPELTPSMTRALDRMSEEPRYTDDICAPGASLLGLVQRGLIEKSETTPPQYTITKAGLLVRAILHGEVRLPCLQPQIATIKDIVASHFGIPAMEMVSERRARRFARPRQVAMYLASKHTGKSLPTIGRQFGGRDHTTVIHAVRRIESLSQTDQALSGAVAAIEQKIAEAAQ